MKLSSRFNATRKTHPILSYGAIFVFIVCLLLVTLRVAITPLAESGIVRWLGDNGVTATIKDIQLDLTEGHISLTGFDAHDDDGHAAHIGTLEADWRWKPLYHSWLVVNRIRLDDFHIDAEFFADGTMNIAGLRLPLASAGTDHENNPDKDGSEATHPFDVSLTRIDLSKIHACVKQHGSTDSPVLNYCFSLGSLKWDGDIHYALSPQTSSDDLPLSVTGTLNLSTIAAQNMSLQRNLLTIDAVNFSNIKLDGLKKISLEKLGIESVAALERAKNADDGPEQMLSFQNLSINGVQLLNMNSLAINDIDLKDLSAYLKIQKDGQFEFDEWLPRIAASQTAKQTGAKPEQVASDARKTAFQYSLTEFKYSSSRPITFVDNHSREDFSYELPTLKFVLGPVDSSKPGELTHIQLAASTDKNASLSLDADLSPLAKKPDLKGKLKISGLDLRAFSPLTRQYIGHTIRSGQLDSNITLQATNGVLDSNIALTLNQFELRPLNKKEAEQLNSELGFPLNTSLSLLRDSDNRIKLDIPVTGDINSPDFDPADAIKTATSKAVTAAVLYYYTPYGLVLAANAAFDLATALHFDPVVFSAGQHKLEASQTEQIDKIAKMLSQRPGVHLTLCGISNKADAASLYPESIKKTADQTTASKSVLNKEQISSLMQLAEQRSDAVKDYLVKSKNIDASRLIVCEPEYRESANAPVVEISI